MKSGWVKTTIGGLIRITHGYAFKGEYFVDYESNDVLVTPGNFSIGGGFQLVKPKFYDGPVDSKWILVPGDVVVTMTDLSKAGDTLGYSAKIPHDVGCRLLHNQRIGKLALISDEADLEFVYWYMRTKWYQEFIAQSASGSTVRHTSPKKIYRAPIWLPPLRIQQKIARILSAFDELIENNLKRIKLLEEKAQQTYEEWFVRMRFPGHESTPVDPDTGLPEGWEVRRHEDICDLSGGGTPSRKNSAYWEEGVIDWYTPTDLTKANCSALLGSAEKTNELGLQRSSAKRLPKQAFMMTSRATIGYVGFVNSDFSTNQGFINVLPHAASDKEYLAYNFMIRKEEFIGLGTGTTFLEISKGVFRKLNIVWPTAQVRESYSDVVTPLHSMIFQLLEANLKLREARDILLPRLMTGMIDVEKLDVEVPIKA